MASSDGERKIIVAVDGSEDAFHALEFYFGNVKQENDIVCLVNVPDNLELSLASSPSAFDRQLKTLHEEVAALEKSCADLLKGKNVNGKFRTGAGKPGEVICKIAHEERPEMIIMGSRGRGKLGRALFGSVSDYVIHHSHVPVFVCRNKHHQQNA